MTNTDEDKLLNILQDMKLEENKNTSDEKKLDVVIIITIIQKDGSECEIGLLADTINIDGKVYNTDKNYIEIIEKAFKLR